MAPIMQTAQNHRFGFEPAFRQVIAGYRGIMLADSMSAMLLREARYAPVILPACRRARMDQPVLLAAEFAVRAPKPAVTPGTRALNGICGPREISGLEKTGRSGPEQTRQQMHVEFFYPGLNR